MKRYIIATICGIFSVALMAQDNEDLSIEVMRPYDPSLPNADKVNVIPRIAIDTAADAINVSYALKTIKPLSAGYLLSPIPPAKVQHEAIGDAKKLQGYIKIGIGYPLSTLFDASIGGSVASGLVWNAYAMHYGALGDVVNTKNDKVPTMDIYNDVGIGVRKAFSSNFIAFNAGFAPRFVNYYGYDATKYTLDDYNNNINSDSIAQSYVKSYAQLVFGGSHKTWNYNLELSFHDLRAKHDRNEDALQAEIFVDKNIDTSFVLGSAIDADIYMRSAALSDENHIHFAIAPYARYNKDWLEAAADLNLTIDKHHTMQVLFFPSVSISALLFDNVFSPYAEFNSKYSHHSFADVIAENPYIHPFIPIDLHETRNYDFILGIKGKYNSIFDYKIMSDYSIIRNAYFFYNTEDVVGSYFNFIYDNGGCLSVNLHSSVMFSHSFELAIDYKFQKYYLDSLKFPLHKPEHLITGMARYTLWNKIVFQTFINLRGCYYSIANSGDYEKQNAGIDLNFNVEYRFFNHSSAFLYLNNIFSQKYQLYSGYNVYGFGAMVGYSFKF